MVNFNLRISKELRKRFKVIASKNEKTMSEILIKFITQYVNEKESEVD